jgi:hypothetical protein
LPLRSYKKIKSQVSLVPNIFISMKRHSPIVKHNFRYLLRQHNFTWHFQSYDPLDISDLYRTENIRFFPPQTRLNLAQGIGYTPNRLVCLIPNIALNCFKAPSIFSAFTTNLLVNCCMMTQPPYPCLCLGI